MKYKYLSVLLVLGALALPADCDPAWGAPQESANQKSTTQKSASHPPKSHTPATSSQVPGVVQSLQDKYGLPVELPAVTSTMAPVTTLSQLVGLQRLAYADACVTSTFYDYRSVSKYRSKAGLHLGYDIAMPAASAVRVGWPGTVVSIAPWYTNEWGVSVLSSNGVEVTYGHIVPEVRVGQTLNTGDIVGKVSVNHVDVKMRDKNGNYVPFGEGDKTAGTGFANMLPTNSRESLMVGWLVAQNALDSAQQEWEARCRELKLAKVDRERLEERYATLHRQEVQMTEFLEQGLVSRVEVEKCKRDLNNVRASLLLAKQLQNHVPTQIASAQHRVNLAQKKLKSAQKLAQKEGITWKDVSALVNEAVARDQKLTQQVKDFKKSKSTKNDAKRLELKREIASQEKKVVEYKRIYEEGGLPRKELETAETRLENLREELQRLDL